MLDATQALTVLAEIDPKRRALLETRLVDISADLDHNPVFRPCELPDTHFMRFVIIDDPRDELPALLAWEVNHDRNADVYLATVARKVPSIDAVFACCTGYPAAGARDPEAWVAWIRARSLRAAAFYTAYRGIPRQQVVNDRRVHEAIRATIDRCDRVAIARLPRCEIQREICEAVRTARPELDVTVQDEDELRWAVGKLLAIVGALAILPFLLAIAVPWYLVLRTKERNDIALTYGRPVHDDRRLAVAEDKATQNQLTHVVDIKPGTFRLATLWFVLTAIDVIARVYAVRGDLGGIVSIHFARWVIVRDPRSGSAPKRHRLVFFSNYDGSWESYLGEFIDRAAYGLTAIWSNTVGFPATQRLVGAGARDEEAFKQWTRDHQIPTQVWWTGVSDSTVQNIRDDIWIRRQLDRGMGDGEVEAWLGKL